jgi:hypothetical protein
MPRMLFPLMKSYVPTNDYYHKNLGGEMNQALYAHMNIKRKMKKNKNLKHVIGFGIRQCTEFARRTMKLLAKVEKSSKTLHSLLIS